MKQILVVDDEGGIRELLSEILTDEGYQVLLANNAEDARKIRRETRPDLVLLDIWMPDTDGITLLKEWGARGQLSMPVIMMSGHGTIDTAVEATKIGAHTFLEKPFAVRKLLTVVSSALHKQTETKTKIRSMLSLVGGSKKVQRFRAQVEKLKSNRTSVLILAEPGLQANDIAKELHPTGEPWIELVNSDYPENWKVKSKRANTGGVIYFRDVHHFKPSNQKIVKHYLNDIQSSGLRVIGSSLDGISSLIAKGEFDTELYSLLAEVLLVVPTLSSRPEDIPELASTILEREIEMREIRAKRFSTAALNALRNGFWPGNIVQLEAVVKTSLQLATGELIDLDEVEGVLEKSSNSLSYFGQTLPFDLGLKEARDIFEKMYFEYHLDNEKGSITRVSALTGVERTHLYRKLKNLGINVNRRSTK